MDTHHPFFIDALGRLRAAIESVKQRDLADELGVSEPHISQLKKQPNPTIKKIARVLSAVERIKARK